MDCSTPGFPIHHQLPEFTQTHVHRVGDDIQASHPLSSPSPPAFNFAQHQGLFQWVSFFASGGQSNGVSTSASVLPKNIQEWFPLGLTCLVSLYSKDPQESPPMPQFKSINSSALSFLYGPTLTSIQEYWKNHWLWITTNCGKFLKKWAYQTTLPASWEICMKVKKQELKQDIEQQTGSKLGKEYVKAVYCHPAYLTYIQST